MQFKSVQTGRLYGGDRVPPMDFAKNGCRRFLAVDIDVATVPVACVLNGWERRTAPLHRAEIHWREESSPARPPLCRLLRHQRSPVASAR
ncbi:hypothetical protein GCM10009760_27450 [Kitasatospora kazusensis]|uniref:Uncharacterized protein n=1 Tax=Kitasatospora kazusensis TaxID=407974 RepID=A0ABN2ZHN3_9ACTN